MLVVGIPLDRLYVRGTVVHGFAWAGQFLDKLRTCLGQAREVLSLTPIDHFAGRCCVFVTQRRLWFFAIAKKPTFNNFNRFADDRGQRQKRRINGGNAVGEEEGRQVAAREKGKEKQEAQVAQVARMALLAFLEYAA